jgi:hypothetical protein
MAGLPLVVVFLLLAAFDAVGLLIAIGWIAAPAPLVPLALATAIHVGCLLIAGTAIVLSRKARARPGFVTLAAFAVAVAGLTPVLGFVIGAWLISPGIRRKLRGDSRASIRFGNPLALSRRGLRAVATPHTQPLAIALRHGHRSLQRNTAPLLRSIGGGRAADILRDLIDQPDARAHLYAQAALATLTEGAEAGIDRLRYAVETAPDSIELRERLAGALLHSADMKPDDRTAALREAGRHYDHALGAHSADASCLFGKAMCLIRKNDLDPVPDLYGRLCAVPGAASYADQLELAYFSAMGNWTRTAEAVQRLSSDPASRDLGANCRRFWLTTRGE